MLAMRLAVAVVASVAAASVYAQPVTKPGPAQPVQIMNPSTSPVPVTGTISGSVSVSNVPLPVTVPSTQRSWAVNCNFISAGSNLTGQSFTISPGRPGVIESVSVSCSFGAAAGEVVMDMGYVQVTSPTPANVTPTAPGQLTAQAEADLPVLRSYVPHTAINLPFDGTDGNVIHVGVQTNVSTTSTYCHVTLVGHFTD